MNAMLILLGFTIFIFAPFELFMTNIDDLWFNIYDFSGYVIVAFGAYIVLALIFCLLFRKNKGLVSVLSYIAFLVTVALYVQGNFLLTDYGHLDGQPINWGDYFWPGVISVSWFGIVIIGGLLLFYILKDKRDRLIKICNVIAICMILMQITTLAIVSLSKNVFTYKEAYVVTDKNEWTYSGKDNYIVLILDSYDSRVFDELYNGGYADELNSTFEDFTYYRNTTDTYSLTDFSVPQIVTGKKYLNETSYGEYLEAGYETSPLLNRLKQDGYSLNVYVKTNIPQGEVTSSVDNWSKQRIGVTSHKKLLVYLYQLVGFRYLPQPMKQICWTYTEAIDDTQTIAYDDNLIEWANYYFRENIKNIDANQELPMLHIYHLKGIHVPRNYDSNFNLVDEQVDLYESAKGVNKMVREYLDRLKELGIYDDAKIIILADHAANEYEELQFKQCPLLLVKGSKEKHSFAIDETPVSYEDLHTGFINLQDGITENIFEITDTNRDRYHYETTWLARTIADDEFSNEFEEYIIKGHAFDSESIVPTGETY